MDGENAISRRRLLALSVALPMSALLTGCGGDDEDEEDDD